MCLISTVKLAVVWQPVVNVSVQNSRQPVMIYPVSRCGGVTVSRESQNSEFQTTSDDVSDEQGEAISGVAVSRESQISEFQTARDDVTDEHGEVSSGVVVSRESENSEFQTARDDVTHEHGEASSGMLDILTAIA